MEKQKHMDNTTRNTIEIELGKGTSFKKIGKIIGKDCTTVSKEVKKHSVIECKGSYGRAFNDCVIAVNHKCDKREVCERCFSHKRPCWSCGKCIETCPLYEKKVCNKLQKPPYVCNGCSEQYKCTLEKRFYRASAAQQEYETERSESRSGFAVTEAELKHLDAVISPLLRQGQSLHHIGINHVNEIMKSERTLYTYVNHGLLTARNIDMPRTVRMRPRKKPSKQLKVDKACRIKRTYDDYKQYMEEHPDTPICQCDSVEGVKGGAVLLTIEFITSSLQLAFFREANDSQSVIDLFDKLYLDLGQDTFRKLFPVLLCDNGSEFSNPLAIEFDKQKNPRTKVFYCNPNAPYEKPNCENNHEMIRRVIPKGVDIGQFTQDQISEMMSHINSYSRNKLGDKSPYDFFAFQYGQEVLKAFGLRNVPADEIILSPKLFKK